MVIISYCISVSKGHKTSMPYHNSVSINNSKSFKFIFTVLALFYYQLHYSQGDAYTIEESNYIDIDSPKMEEKGLSNSNFTSKEKKLKKFEPSVNDKTELKGYSFHEKYYTVNFPIDMVWDAYENTEPNECWSGPLTVYKNSYLNSLLHNSKEANHPSFDEGCIYLVRLKLIPFIKITAIFQLTKLNRSEKIIELIYGMDNTSHGKQTIQFIADGDKTLIKHTTYFKSKSPFRDKYLYPKFHVKYIDEFHVNIQKKLMDNNTNNAVANQE
ncbi:MAG: hypothetical protein GQ552_00610 [Flavobacteriaceae bacterium]|nr:hypothetical protein [Flavobacteriaceae bacterium]